MAKSPDKAVDLGTMQSELESATRGLKAAGTTLQRAQISFASAEERYAAANRSLISGFQTLRGATKIQL